MILALGPFGLGGPEMLFLVVVAVVVILVSRSARGRSGPSRACPGCGRGLRQPPDAPFCCYCGHRLP